MVANDGTRYASEWKQAVDATAAAFPSTRVIVNLSQTWDEVADPTGTSPGAWVATTVGDYAIARYGLRVDLQNASVPLIFPALITYFSAKARAGSPISAQIGWQHLSADSSLGGTSTARSSCRK